MTDDRGAVTDFEVLFRHCTAITASLEMKDVITTTLAAAAELLPSDQVVLTIVEDGLIKVLAADPPVSLEIMENGLAVGRGLVGRAVAERTPVYSPDLYTDERVEQTRQRWDSDDRSVVAVPLALGDQVIGALHAISHRVDAFSEQDRARIVALAPAVATAMRNALVLQSEREAWAHRRKLDRQKTVFMRMAARGLKQPLEEVDDLVTRLSAEREDPDLVAQRLLDRSQRLAEQIEEVLELSMKDSSDIVLPRSTFDP